MKITRKPSNIGLEVSNPYNFCYPCVPNYLCLFDLPLRSTPAVDVVAVVVPLD